MFLNLESVEKSDKIFTRVTWEEVAKNKVEQKTGGGDPEQTSELTREQIKKILNNLQRAPEDKKKVIEYFGLDKFKNIINNKKQEINFEGLKKLKQISVYYFLCNLKETKEAEAEAEPEVSLTASQGAQSVDTMVQTDQSQPSTPKQLTKSVNQDTIAKNTDQREPLHLLIDEYCFGENTLEYKSNKQKTKEISIRIINASLLEELDELKNNDRSEWRTQNLTTLLIFGL